MVFPRWKLIWDNFRTWIVFAFTFWRIEKNFFHAPLFSQHVVKIGKMRQFCQKIWFSWNMMSAKAFYSKNFVLGKPYESQIRFWKTGLIKYQINKLWSNFFLKNFSDILKISSFKDAKKINLIKPPRNAWTNLQIIELSKFSLLSTNHFHTVTLIQTEATRNFSFFDVAEKVDYKFIIFHIHKCCLCSEPSKEGKTFKKFNFQGSFAVSR